MLPGDDLSTSLRLIVRFWIYYIAHVSILVFEATKMKFKPILRVSSYINPEMRLTPTRRASSGLYAILDVVTKNFPVTLGASLFSLAIVKKKKKKVRTKLNNFKYFSYLSLCFSIFGKGSPHKQNSKINPLH